jgi:crotonobetainyl-CoA:carnitine CoA-transferase CaiB-like acyl-CoA transferase
MADPQVVARGTMVEAEDGAGRFLVPNPPFQFADRSVAAGRKVPALGEHTRDLLESILKMDASEISELTDRSVVDGR